MYPELLRFGDFVISSFGAMMVIAFITGNLLLKRDVVKMGMDSSIADELTFRAAIGGILGAKIYYIIENIPGDRGGLDNLLGIVDIFMGIFTFNLSRIADGIQNFGAGMVFYGGFIGGVFAVTLFIRKQKLNWKSVADWMVPYLVLGHSIGRIGCFLVGDDYGKATDLPWGIAFPNGAPPVHIPVHPTQLYEMIAYLIIFFILSNRRFKKLFQGEIMYMYMVLVGIARFFVEIIRLNPKYFYLSGAQWISIILIISGIFFLVKNRMVLESTKEKAISD
ncbi:MAG: prolipoprotein diacylglyceryl transferase [Candidatus Marinimicrobia bacterium]|jgi:phosphatidylglycerol:prolipoprotein diacylglycerol transferase|nr:prolipoprotein diacylglyceryl transferase [Candidatus Neomarinimicrobiota bacterium]MBT3634442.1 prolipoprotein diacylglyceryl transferase [Candidatus Neomarinimicrobiota bacterium]MBT3683269.1 prolipoprotein diacylglyceryl transferase [Candidatus Neomarinimicrobiota bacterium]MBT3760157.1 prolipoprotein diacylglyceryl transferase [Candidatus Neomarinimicrobiota bacterium]MBT3896252.1 prolipoprotein diacylglyceryl transferase [Candidatus Neomarinimicrobiota bacterium]